MEPNHSFFISPNKEILINSTKFGSGGRLYNRLRYLKRLQKDDQNSSAPPPPQNVNFQDSSNHLLWLKTVVVSDTNFEEITTKLEMTRAHRDEMVLRDSVELLQEFPFFFTHPLLVDFVKFFYFFIVNSMTNSYEYYHYDSSVAIGLRFDFIWPIHKE